MKISSSHFSLLEIIIFIVIVLFHHIEIIIDSKFENMDADRSVSLNDVHLDDGNEMIEKTEKLDQILLESDTGEKNEKDDGTFIIVCRHL
jgi:hypothetical protein